MSRITYKQTGKYLPPQIDILGIYITPGDNEITSEQLTEIREIIKSDRMLKHYFDQKILSIAE
jgi:hypothetical protein